MGKSLCTLVRLTDYASMSQANGNELESFTKHACVGRHRACITLGETMMPTVADTHMIVFDCLFPIIVVYV